MHREVFGFVRYSRYLICLATLSFVACYLTGCGGGSEEGGDSTNESASAAKALDPNLSGQEILKNVAARYKSANTYVDRGEFVLGYQLEGQPRRENHPFELAFRRPNELHLRAFNTSLMSNGGEMAFAVNDPATRHMDQQVVVQNATTPLNLGAIFRDPIASFFAAGGAEIPLAPQVEQPHIELMHPALALLTEHTDPAWFGRANEAQRIGDARHRSEKMYRVQINSPNGKYVIWVQPETWVIRRLDFPVRLLDPELSEAPQVAELKMYVDLSEAEVDANLPPEAFDFRLPPDAKRLTQFVSLPEPFPSMLVGNVPQRFQLPLVGDKTFSSADLEGRTTAMLWFSSDPVCEPVVQQFGELRGELQSLSNLQLIAVNTEPVSKMSDVRLLDLMNRWRCREWVARADQAIGRDIFDIRTLPTIVVFDDRGVVQYYKTIDDGQLKTGLKAVLQRVASGEDVAADMRQEYEKYLGQYEAQLAELSFDRHQFGPQTNQPGTNNGPTSFVTDTIAPSHLRLTSAWKQSELKAPGNLFIGPNKQLVALDGFRTIVELDLNGSVKSRSVLELPAGDSITFLRPLKQTSNFNSKQTTWLASSLLGQRVFGLNDRLQITGAWPPQGSTHHAGIREALWSVDRSDASILLGFWQSNGIERWSSDGKKINSQTELEQLNSIVPLRTQQGSVNFYAVASNDGMIRVVDSDLKLINTVSVPRFSVTHLFAAQNAEGAKANEAQLIGLAPVNDQTYAIIGLSSKLEVLWEASIPAGQFTYPIEFVQSAMIPSSSRGAQGATLVWLVARPNGMIHAFSSDGQWQDQFSVGVVPQGLTVTRNGDKARLIVSHPGGLSAWDLATQVRISAKPNSTR